MPWQMWVVTLGLLLIVAGTLLPLLRVEGTLNKYLYAAGAIVLLIGRFSTPGVGKNVSLRLQRMCRLETWSAIIFAVGAVFQWLPSAGNRDWLAFTLAGGIIQVYTSIMIPIISKKDNA